MKFSNICKIIASGLIVVDALFLISLPVQAQRGNNQSQILISQAAKTRKIVVSEFGYSFNVPTWARVIKNGNRLEILTQKQYEQRQRGQNKCFFEESNLAGCAEFSITIEGNGRKKLAEVHKQYITPCQCDVISGSNVYKGKITVNGRTYRKYETGDEGGSYNVYLYLTNKNHLITVVLYKEPYAGNRDALVTAMGSFKE
jgi:hypothetical protein